MSGVGTHCQSDWQWKLRLQTTRLHIHLNISEQTIPCSANMICVWRIAERKLFRRKRRKSSRLFFLKLQYHQHDNWWHSSYHSEVYHQWSDGGDVLCANWYDARRNIKRSGFTYPVIYCIIDIAHEKQTVRNLLVNTLLRRSCRYWTHTKH